MNTRNMWSQTVITIACAPPPMELAHHAERYVLAEIDDVGVGVLDRRAVVEHEQEAR